MACLRLTDDQRDRAERYLPLCEATARRFARRYPHVGRGEFLSAAFEGLADAVAAHDPARGVRLATFARPRIEGECLDLLRRVRGGAIYRPRKAGAAAYRVISCHAAPPPPGREPDPSAALEAADNFERLLEGLGAVPRFVMRQVYARARPFREVADHLGVCPSRVSQIHAAALPILSERAIRLGLAPPGGRPVALAPRRPRPWPWPRPRSRGVAAAVDPVAIRAFLASLAGVPAADLEGLLGRLKPRQRRAIELCDGLDGTARPWAEVARLLGLTPPGVAYVYKAGLETLRAMAREGRSPP